jgi:hypothetical protein
MTAQFEPLRQADRDQEHHCGPGSRNYLGCCRPPLPGPAAEGQQTHRPGNGSRGGGEQDPASDGHGGKPRFENPPLEPAKHGTLYKAGKHQQRKPGRWPEGNRSGLGHRRGKEAEALAGADPRHPADKEGGPARRIGCLGIHRHGPPFMVLPA